MRSWPNVCRRIIGFVFGFWLGSTASAWAQDASVITDRELNIVFSIIEAKATPPGDEGLKIMARERMTLKRLQEILGDIAVVMPSVQTDRVLRNPPPKADKKRLEEAKRAMEAAGLKHFETRGGRASFEQTFKLLSNHAERIEKSVMSQFEPIRGTVTR